MKITFLEVFTRVGVSRVDISVWTNKEHLLALLFYNIILSVTQCLADHWGAQLLQSGGEHNLTQGVSSANRTQYCGYGGYL